MLSAEKTVRASSRMCSHSQPEAGLFGRWRPTLFASRGFLDPYPIRITPEVATQEWGHIIISSNWDNSGIVWVAETPGSVGED